MENQVLARFPFAVQQRLLRSGQRVDLPVRTELYKAGNALRHVYFLTGGMASIVVQMLDGESVEVGMIGNEGMVGVPALLGPPTMNSHCFMQLAGSGLRVPLRELQACFDQDAQVRSVVHQFVRSQLTIAEQVSACNRMHEAEPRLARWLLTSADRIHDEQVDLTQEFLSEMLGMQRTTVALVAGYIQRTGAITYSRGRVRIVDRPALIKLACECYPLIKAATAGPDPTLGLSAA